MIWSCIWPRVHKETENEDQAQNQIDKLQYPAQKLFKFVERTSDGFMGFSPIFRRLTKMHRNLRFGSIWYQNVRTIFVFTLKVKNIKRK